MNVENTSKQNYSVNEIIKKIEVKNSPLTIAGNDEDGWFIAMGKYKLSEEKYKDEFEARAGIENEMWNIITRMIFIISGEEIRSRENELKEEETK